MVQVTTVGDLTIDRARREVTRAGRLIALTPKEFGVLDELVRAEGAWLSSEHLLTRVWDENADPFSSAVKITITRLRAKLGAPDLIVTERGVGYRLVTPGVAPGVRVGRGVVGRGMVGREMVGRGMVGRGMVGRGMVGRGMVGRERTPEPRDRPALARPPTICAAVDDGGVRERVGRASSLGWRGHGRG
jgi:hypothetical protein